jgi:hypothetical protein
MTRISMIRFSGISYIFQGDKIWTSSKIDDDSKSVAAEIAVPRIEPKHCGDPMIEVESLRKLRERGSESDSEERQNLIREVKNAWI